uniref:Similarity. Hypothetical start n=1 Tax=Microcystis aeruginosa (strain PCC 7806) TaxID=267872 RepID=A8YGN9_MICA7|nr:unnamed protein product [Microcystis aeruginosa PCC 7806]
MQYVSTISKFYSFFNFDRNSSNSASTAESLTLFAGGKLRSSGFCVEGRRIGIIWVRLNLVEISRGHFGRTQFDKLTDHGAPLPLAPSYYFRGELHSPSLNNFCCSQYM